VQIMALPYLEINTENVSDSVAFLTLVGEADIYTSPVLREKLDTLIEKGKTRILMDLSHLEYIDSTGIGVIKAGLAQTRGCDGDIRLLFPKAQVKRMLELMDMHKPAEIYSNRDEALKDW